MWHFKISNVLFLVQSMSNIAALLATELGVGGGAYTAALDNYDKWLRATLSSVMITRRRDQAGMMHPLQCRSSNVVSMTTKYLHALKGRQRHEAVINVRIRISTVL